MKNHVAEAEVFQAVNGLEALAKERVIALGAQLHMRKPINADKMKEILDII